MPLFECKFKDKYGKIVERNIFADKLDVVLKILREQRCEVISAREKKRSLIERITMPRRGVSRLKLAVFSRQVATMLGAGVTLVNTLNSISKHEENRAFGEALSDVLSKIYMGYRLSTALQIHKEYFSDFFVSLVRVGELSGSLQYTFEKIANYQERDSKWVNSLKSASTYPATICAVGVVIFIFLTFYFIPSFAKIYEKINMPLPFFTKVILGSTTFISRPFNLFIIIGVIVAMFTLIISYLKTPVGKKKLDEFVLNMPLAGNIFNKVIIIRFLIGLEVLYNSGIALLDAISEVKKNVGNIIYEEILNKAENDIKQGANFSESLAGNQKIPKVVSSMICVGEESGRLNLSFRSLVKIYEEDVQYALDGAVALAEPFAIIFLAVIIGVVVVAMLVPLYNLISTF